MSSILVVHAQGMANQQDSSIVSKAVLPCSTSYLEELLLLVGVLQPAAFQQRHQRRNQLTDRQIRCRALPHVRMPECRRGINFWRRMQHLSKLTAFWTVSDRVLIRGVFETCNGPCCT